MSTSRTPLPGAPAERRTRLCLRLAVDDPRLTLAEQHAEPTRWGTAERFRQLALVGAAVETRYAAQYLPRPTHPSAARAGLALPVLRLRIEAPPPLLPDFRAARAAGLSYAQRFLRLVEFGLLHEQALSARPAPVPIAGSATAPAPPAVPPPLRSPASLEEAAAKTIAGFHAALEADW